MFDLLLREIKQRLVKPFIDLLKSRKFSPNYLTTLGFIAGICCNISILYNQIWIAYLFAVVNRFFDGIDGSYARMTKQQTTFGGYYDIILDFICYALTPISLQINAGGQEQNNFGTQQYYYTFIALAFMQGAFFVNAASLFQLSAILEQKNLGVSLYILLICVQDCKQAKSNKEMTTVTMPKALIEGFETMVFYTFFLLSPYSWLLYLYSIFSVGVVINIIYRLAWAYKVL